MQFVLLRHAHAGRRAAWGDADELRPLSDRGFRQADDLAASLAPRRPDLVLSSPRLRCVQTVSPLARMLGLEVEIDDRLDEGPDIDALGELFDECNGITAVASTHGDVVPELLGMLRARRGMVLTDQFVWPKASAWVIRREPNGDPVRAKYLAPPERLTVDV